MIQLGASIPAPTLRFANVTIGLKRGDRVRILAGAHRGRLARITKLRFFADHKHQFADARVRNVGGKNLHISITLDRLEVLLREDD